jgi:dipeptidyl-peptidase-4
LQFLTLCVTGFCLALPMLATAQGARADYERANTLSKTVAGKVFRASVKPEWIGTGNRFWYRNDLADGKREFILVDSTLPGKRPAFDHARMAAALTRTLGRPITADKLPVDRITFPEGKANGEVQVQVRDKTYACDLTTYELREVNEPLGRATPLPPDDAPHASRSGSDETLLTFLNKTDGEISLYWLDAEGERREYGSLKPGESRPQHTFVGHAWLATRKDGVPLAVFVAQDGAALAVIDGAPPAPRRRGNRRQEEVDLSPDGKLRAIVRDNNVFLHDNATGEETPLTHDGTTADAYQGRPYWSPDGRHLAVMRVVPAQEHKIYMVESSPRDQEQPRLHSLDYLKPGDRIAHPRPRLFDVAARREIAIKEDLFPNPWDIDDIVWEPDGRRFTFLYNQRGHQVMRLMAVDAETGEARAVIDEQAKTFIDWTNKVFLHRLDKTHEAIWMSERDGWNHLYLYDTAAGSVKNQITKGEWVVRGVDRVDEEKRQIWFHAGGIVPGQDPYYVHYCRVNFDGSGLTVLTGGDGTHRVDYSPDGRYLVDTWSRVDLPPVTEVRRVADGAKVCDLERGDASALLATGWRYPERFVAKGRDGKTDIYGVIFRPSNFDPKRKYPVVEDIYAGPQGSFAPKAFTPAYGAQQMAELGFVVVQMDGMGTNNRSKAFHDVCWQNLADAGFPDRILWIRAAAAKYPYMDLSRVGIYGTSAGGQNALGGLLLHGDFYKVGVADCGCHDNRMDKIWWNEQWMGWPIGPHYAEQSNVTLAPKLQGKLLLMVGEMDTNVDPASTMQVVNALIKADKDFDLLVVPGAGHGVVGTPYGHRREQDFLVQHLLGVQPRWSGPARSAAKRAASQQHASL